MSAKQARHIRRRSRSQSQNENGCGLSELFLASPADAPLSVRTDLAATQIIPLARAASASALQRYRVGEVEFTSVLETQDELFRAQLDLARLVSQYGAGRTELAALTGEEWYR